MRATGRLGRLAEWAWARHHNVLSWYVRVVSGRGIGWAVLAPAGAGLAVGDVVLVVAARSRRRRLPTSGAVASG